VIERRLHVLIRFQTPVPLAEISAPGVTTQEATEKNRRSGLPTVGARVPLQVPAVLRPVCRTDALGEVYAHLRSAATEHPNDLQGTA